VALSLAVARQSLACCEQRRVSFRRTLLKEALSSLLTVWVLLVSRALPVVIQTGALELFSSLVHAGLAAAPLECDQEEEEEEDDHQDGGDGDEFLQDLACLARVNLSASLALLLQVMEHHRTAQTAPEVRCESVSFLVELLAMILADPDEGETPQLPQVVAASTDNMPVRASLVLLETFQLESGSLHTVSPLLSETLLRSIKLWTESYLYAPDLPPLFHRFSSPASREAEEILRFLVQCACVHLQQFGAEERVGKAAVALLESVSRKRAVNSVWVIKTCSAWRDVVTAHLASLKDPTWAPMQLVSAVSHGDLLRVLTNACSDAGKVKSVLGLSTVSSLKTPIGYI
jgi:ABC-type transporter Mla MlaB component